MTKMGLLKGSPKKYIRPVSRAKRNPDKKSRALKTLHVASIRSPGRSFVASMVVSEKENIPRSDGALLLPSLTNSEIELRYTSNGSPLLFEKYKGVCKSPREN
jgi:hypothetical protein